MNTTSPASHSVIFDIETAGLPPDFLDMLMPEFEAPKNYKDKDVIAANIAEQKSKWLDKAALSPMTGKVLVVGIRDLDGSFSILDGAGDEKALLQDFTQLVDSYKDETFIGWNIFGFDLPFLQKRCVFHGIKPVIRFGWDQYRQEQFVDAMALWKGRDGEIRCSLDAVARFLGVGEKSGNGKDFARLWETDKGAATAYLKKDIELTEAIARRMGVLV